MTGVESLPGSGLPSTYSASDLLPDRGQRSGLGNKGSAHSSDEPLLGLLCGGGIKGVGVPALDPQELTG